MLCGASVDPAARRRDRDAMKYAPRLALVLVLAIASAAGAQRYRVLVGEAGSSRVSLVEFRPCVPAETSDCGAWLLRSFASPSDAGMRPAGGDQRVVSSRAGTVAIKGEIVVASSSAAADTTRVSGTHGHPIALVMAEDGAYAFGIFDGAGDASPELAMIDLNTRSVWAVFPLRARPAGIAIAP
jgi:hypothetical protein